MRTWVVGTFAPAFTRPTSTLLLVADLIVRVGLGALGVLFLHDSVWWKNSWFFGKPMGGWWKSQSQNAQGLYRISLGMFGLLTVFASVFGTIMRP